MGIFADRKAPLVRKDQRVRQERRVLLDHRAFQARPARPGQQVHPAKLVLQERLVPPDPRECGLRTSSRAATWRWVNSPKGFHLSNTLSSEPLE